MAFLPLLYVNMKSFCHHQYIFTAAKFRVSSSLILMRELLRFRWLSNLLSKYWNDIDVICLKQIDFNLALSNLQTKKRKEAEKTTSTKSCKTAAHVVMPVFWCSSFPGCQSCCFLSAYLSQPSLVKTELKTPFCTASQAPPTGFFRFQIADSNLETFDKNENFQTPVAALDRDTKSKWFFLCCTCSFSEPHLIEKWVNSHLSHTQAHSLFTFLIVFSLRWQPNTTKFWCNEQKCQANSFYY